MKPNNPTPQWYSWHPEAPQCYKITQEFPYNIGNAMTYLWRAGKKPGNHTIQDYQKAIDHISFEIERIQSMQNQSKRKGKKRRIK